VLWVLLTVQSGTFHTARYRNRSDRHLNFAQIGFILAAHLSSRKDKSLFPRLKQLLSVSFIVVCVLMTWLSVLAGNGGVIRVPYMRSQLVAPACVPAGAIFSKGFRLQNLVIGRALARGPG
jgi:hypothetical protein